MNGDLLPRQRLSEWFTWDEAWHSETAERLGIDNTPPAAVRPNIQHTATRMDVVRNCLGKPILVSSWYRCLDLNTAVGSRPTSDHLTGYAVDFRSPAYGPPSLVFELLKSLVKDLRIDQLILEFPKSKSGGWVHVSFAPAARLQALVIDANGTRLA